MSARGSTSASRAACKHGVPDKVRPAVTRTDSGQPDCCCVLFVPVGHGAEPGKERPGLVAILNMTGSVFTGSNNLKPEPGVTSGADIHSKMVEEPLSGTDTVCLHEPVYMYTIINPTSF